MLILVGVILTLTLGEHGIFKTSEEAVVKTEYTAAKEIVDLKLMDIQTNCITNNITYSIEEIAKRMKEDERITIEKYYNSSVALVKNGIEEKLVNLKAILVSANYYPKYKFLIGENGKIEKMTTQNVTDTTTLEEDLKQALENIDSFEIKLGIYNPPQQNTNIFEELQKNNKTVDDLAEYGITITRVGADQSDYHEIGKLGQGSSTGEHHNICTLTIDYNTFLSKSYTKEFRGIRAEFWMQVTAHDNDHSWAYSKIVVKYDDDSQNEVKTEELSGYWNYAEEKEVTAEMIFDNTKKVSQIQLVMEMYDNDDGGAWCYIKNMELFI